MKNKKVELTAEGKTLAELKFQWCIFQWDSISPLLFVVAIVSKNYILRKYTDTYKFSKSHEKIIHIMYMNGNKLFAKN